MDRRTLFVFLAIIVLPSQGLPVTLDTIESCQQYDSFFEDASEAYNIPSNLLRAAALHESNCKQSEVNPNDGGCGVMQLTGTTKTNVASWFGVTEDELCENSSEGARLNILGGAAALDDFKCYASPRVITNDDLDNCASGLVPEALTDDEKIKLSETLEVWWWPIVQYNGGGADDLLTTSNYPFRVWGVFNDDTFGNMFFLTNNTNISYPPLSDIEYLKDGDLAPDGKIVRYSTGEISSSDDFLDPTPSDLGKPGESGGIRWTDGRFNPFEEVVLHRNDGSVYTSVDFLPCHTIDSGDPVPEGFGAPYNVLSEEQELLLHAFCAADTTNIEVGNDDPSMYIWHKGFEWIGSSWQPIPLICAGATVFTNWCVGAATGTIAATSSYYVSYTCQWTGTEWKCGCRDEECTERFWQLQGISR